MLSQKFFFDFRLETSAPETFEESFTIERFSFVLELFGMDQEEGKTTSCREDFSALMSVEAFRYIRSTSDVQLVIFSAVEDVYNIRHNKYFKERTALYPHRTLHYAGDVAE